MRMNMPNRRSEVLVTEFLRDALAVDAVGVPDLEARPDPVVKAAEPRGGHATSGSVTISASSGGRDGSGMPGTGYLFLPHVNGDSCVVRDGHQAGRRRDLEPVRLHLPAERPA